MTTDRDNEKQKTPKKRYNFRKRKNKKNYKIREQSDDSDSDWKPEDTLISDEEPENVSEDENEESFNSREFQKFIQKIFPSKSGAERLTQLEKLDKLLEKESLRKGCKKKRVVKKKKKIHMIVKEKNEVEEKETDEEATDEEATDEEATDKEATDKEATDVEDDGVEEELDTNEYLLEDEDENMDEDELRDMLANNMKFNIIFTIGDPTLTGGRHGLEEDYEEEEKETRLADDNKLYSKRWFVDYYGGTNEWDEAKVREKECMEKFEKGQKVKIKDAGWDKYYRGIITKVCKNNKYNIRLYDKELDERNWKGIKGKYIKVAKKEVKEDDQILKEMGELIEIRKKKGKNAMLQKFDAFVKVSEEKAKKKKTADDIKEKNKNSIKFRSRLREKNVMNDFKYFRNMDLETQRKVLKNLEDINKHSDIEKPYRLSILESTIPVAFKAYALKKINILNYMDSNSGEYYKIKQWVDTFMQIPFGKYNNLPIKMDDGIDKCSAFMDNAKEELDKCVYGLEDAKMQIMQLVGQWISNPQSVGTAIAIKGPPGTGKTTLIKDGISAILKRPFSFISLGGATDSSFLEGHSYTYEGSNWGKIVDIIIQSKCMNPVIYFDELDKISDTPKGEEITGILTHLTDATQNTQFHDKYFSNVDFDLSKALFIFSYNDESKVNPILKDRMYRIHTKGYETKDKIIIARNHLIPKIEKNINFEKGQLVMLDDTLTNIIGNFTENEKGVRNLKRCLEIVYTKINLFRLMRPDSSLFEKVKVLKIKYPFTITVEMVNKLLKNGDNGNLPFGMYL